MTNTTNARRATGLNIRNQNVTHTIGDAVWFDHVIDTGTDYLWSRASGTIAAFERDERGCAVAVVTTTGGTERVPARFLNCAQCSQALN